MRQQNNKYTDNLINPKKQVYIFIFLNNFSFIILNAIFNENLNKNIFYSLKFK